MKQVAKIIAQCNTTPRVSNGETPLPNKLHESLPGETPPQETKLFVTGNECGVLPRFTSRQFALLIATNKETNYAVCKL